MVALFPGPQFGVGGGAIDDVVALAEQWSLADAGHDPARRREGVLSGGICSKCFVGFCLRGGPTNGWPRVPGVVP